MRKYGSLISYVCVLHVKKTGSYRRHNAVLKWLQHGSRGRCRRSLSALDGLTVAADTLDEAARCSRTGSQGKKSSGTASSMFKLSRLSLKQLAREIKYVTQCDNIHRAKKISNLPSYWTWSPA